MAPAEPISSQDAGIGPTPRPLLQIAPMMEVTHRDFRNFMRLLTRRAQLWTEMVVDDTVLHNLEPAKCDRFLGFNSVEHPVVCQLGGSDPAKLAQAAAVVERYGYDEVNLNVGCPSSRVAAKGEFGCSLMLRKEVVRDIVHAMSRQVQIPVTVKCRLGCDDHDSQEFTREFVRTVAQSGCKHFIVHARKAWLTGLSPAANRTIPPLHYHRVLDLCREFPDLNFSLNGGVTDLGHARALLGFPGERLPGESEELMAHAWDLRSSEHSSADSASFAVPSNFLGVMIGRGAMNNPVMLWDVDSAIYGEKRSSSGTCSTRRSLLDAYREYLEEAHPPDDINRSVGSVHMAVKPTLGLFAGLRGNKLFRSTLDMLMRDKSRRVHGPAHVLKEAMEALESANPGLLDEPLPLTQAYRPGQRSSAAAPDDARGTCVANSDGPPRGRKRKKSGEGSQLTASCAVDEALVPTGSCAAAAAAQGTAGGASGGAEGGIAMDTLTA